MHCEKSCCRAAVLPCWKESDMKRGMVRTKVFADRFGSGMDDVFGAARG